jgi:putative transposase
VLAPLREARRQQSSRLPNPTAAVIDSPSVKTTGDGPQRGYEAAKKVKGRKRHLAVDTQGNLLAVEVHSAALQDRDGARALWVRWFCLLGTFLLM